MRKVSRSALVPWSAEQMYALVEDVEQYPSFLPWCAGAELHSKDAESLEASLSFQRRGISKTFRTRNELWPGEKMTLRLVDGPFRSLVGTWQFEQLGQDGSKVELELEFEFESKVLDALFGRYLEDACNRMIESFTERARVLYG